MINSKIDKMYLYILTVAFLAYWYFFEVYPFKLLEKIFKIILEFGMFFKY